VCVVFRQQLFSGDVPITNVITQKKNLNFLRSTFTVDNIKANIH